MAGQLVMEKRKAGVETKGNTSRRGTRGGVGAGMNRGTEGGGGGVRLGVQAETDAVEQGAEAWVRACISPLESGMSLKRAMTIEKRNMNPMVKASGGGDEGRETTEARPGLQRSRVRCVGQHVDIESHLNHHCPH